MNTDDLINLLATNAGPVKAHSARRRYTLSVACGTAGALALMLSLLRIRPDLAAAAHMPLFWLKVGFVLSLVVAGLFAVIRLSRPGARLDRVPVAIAAPLLAMWAIAVYVLIEADPQQRLGLFLGSTWKVCPLLIAILSIPVFIAVLWAMKGLAPTRPRLAGFSAGLLSGAIAALVYCLHCPELDAPFIGFWYVLGILIPAIVGTLLGRSLLRW